MSVLYSMLPAQLVSFSGNANAETSSGMAAAAVQSLMNVRFFMRANYSHRLKEYSHFVKSAIGIYTRCLIWRGEKALCI